MDHRDTKQAKTPLDLVCFCVIFIFWLFTEISVFDFLPGKDPKMFVIW